MSKDEPLELEIIEHPNIKQLSNGNNYRWKAAIRGYFFNLASFPDLRSLIEFINFHNLHFEFVEAYDTSEYSNEWRCGILMRFRLVERFQDERYFWTLDQVPANAVPTKVYSNGSIVDGFTLREGNVIHIYRPNCNSPEVYKPLPLEEHIAWHKRHGYF